MPQANSNVQLTNHAADLGDDQARNWWRVDDVVNGGTTDVCEVDFTVATTTRKPTLLVGDDPAHAIALPLRLTGGRG